LGAGDRRKKDDRRGEQYAGHGYTVPFLGGAALALRVGLRCGWPMRPV